MLPDVAKTAQERENLGMLVWIPSISLADTKCMTSSEKGILERETSSENERGERERERDQL